MHMKRALLLSAVALVVLAIVFGCSFGITIQGRLDQFLKDLNAASRGQLYLNLDPNLLDYEALKDPAYWGDTPTTGWFPLVDGGTAYSLTSVVIDDSLVTTATVTASIDGPDFFGGPWVIVIGLSKVGLDWMIETITLDGDNVVPHP